MANLSLEFRVPFQEPLECLDLVPDTLNLVELVPANDYFHASITLSQNGHPFCYLGFLPDCMLELEM